MILNTKSVLSICFYFIFWSSLFCLNQLSILSFLCTFYSNSASFFFCIKAWCQLSKILSLPYKLHQIPLGLVYCSHQSYLLLLAVMPEITMLTWCFRSPRPYGLVNFHQFHYRECWIYLKWNDNNTKERKVYSFTPNCAENLLWRASFVPRDLLFIRTFQT